MTYFGTPRLHFAGSIYIDPSTINNTDSNYAEPSTVIPAWNPGGVHYFQLLAGNEPVIGPGATVTPCTVNGIVNANGKFIHDHAEDPLIGQLLVSTNSPTPGKLVDLDVDMQTVSQVWGLQLSIGAAGNALIADFIATNFQQMFTSRAPGGFARGFSAAYQSQLTNLQWPSTIDSPLLNDWKKAGLELLSIRFTVDQINAPKKTPDFKLGRICGTIGPSSAAEPQSITAGRLLRPVPASPVEITGAAKELLAGAPSASDAVNVNVNYAPALVDPVRNVVTFDLGNALPFEVDGSPADAGSLEAAILTSNGPISLGPIGNTLDNYLRRAFLFEFPLGYNSKAAASNPLGILSNGTVVLSENPSGAWIDATEHVYRMDAGTSTTVTLLATTFGATPADGQSVTLGTFAFPDASTNTDWPAPTIPLTVSSSTVTLQNGAATFTVSAGTPGNPRGAIDGLVYGISFSWLEDTDPVANLDVCVHVYDAFDVPAQPQWTDVQPIFEQFMVLYPGMKKILDLSEEATVNANAAVIAKYLGFPIASSKHMPVTRSLSGPKRAMLLRYLAAQ